MGDWSAGAPGQSGVSGGDEPDVVEHGAAPGGGEEVVAEGVLAGIGIEGQLLGVEVTQWESARVTPDDVAVHTAAIYLQLVLVEAMGWRRIDVAQRHVVLDQERLVRQIGREAVSTAGGFAQEFTIGGSVTYGTPFAFVWGMRASGERSPFAPGKSP